MALKASKLAYPMLVALLLTASVLIHGIRMCNTKANAQSWARDLCGWSPSSSTHSMPAAPDTAAKSVAPVEVPAVEEEERAADDTTDSGEDASTSETIQGTENWKKVYRFPAVTDMAQLMEHHHVGGWTNSKPPGFESFIEAAIVQRLMGPRKAGRFHITRKWQSDLFTKGSSRSKFRPSSSSNAQGSPFKFLQPHQLPQWSPTMYNPLRSGACKRQFAWLFNTSLKPGHSLSLRARREAQQVKKEDELAGDSTPPLSGGDSSAGGTQSSRGSGSVVYGSGSGDGEVPVSPGEAPAKATSRPLSPEELAQHEELRERFKYHYLGSVAADPVLYCAGGAQFLDLGGYRNSSVETSLFRNQWAQSFIGDHPLANSIMGGVNPPTVIKQGLGVAELVGMLPILTNIRKVMVEWVDQLQGSFASAKRGTNKAAEPNTTSAPTTLLLKKKLRIIELQGGSGNYLFTMCPPLDAIECYVADTSPSLLRVGQIFFPWIDFHLTPVTRGVVRGSGKNSTSSSSSAGQNQSLAVPGGDTVTTTSARRKGIHTTDKGIPPLIHPTLRAGGMDVVVSNGVAVDLAPQQLCEHMAEGLRLLKHGGRLVVTALTTGAGYRARARGSFFLSDLSEYLDEEGNIKRTKYQPTPGQFLPHCTGYLRKLVKEVRLYTGPAKNRAPTPLPPLAMYNRRPWFAAVLIRSNVSFCSSPPPPVTAETTAQEQPSPQLPPQLFSKATRPSVMAEASKHLCRTESTSSPLHGYLPSHNPHPIHQYVDGGRIGTLGGGEYFKKIEDYVSLWDWYVIAHHKARKFKGSALQWWDVIPSKTKNLRAGKPKGFRGKKVFVPAGATGGGEEANGGA